MQNRPARTQQTIKPAACSGESIQWAIVLAMWRRRGTTILVCISLRFRYKGCRTRPTALRRKWKTLVHRAEDPRYARRYMS
jgi:hypothetical protein